MDGEMGQSIDGWMDKQINKQMEWLIGEKIKTYITLIMLFKTII